MFAGDPLYSRSREGIPPHIGSALILQERFYRLTLQRSPGLRNAWLRLRRQTRYTVLLYHRVNDLSQDNLTTSTRRFAEHLSILRRHYPVLSLSDALEAMRAGRYLGPNVVAITFDDGYADNHDSAAPILERFGLPASFFVTVGHVNTSRPMEHDARSPHQFANLTWEQIRSLDARGFEIGSHGWSHKNLARCPSEEARRDQGAASPGLGDGLPVRASRTVRRATDLTPDVAERFATPASR